MRQLRPWCRLLGLRASFFLPPETVRSFERSTIIPLKDCGPLVLLHDPAQRSARKLTEVRLEDFIEIAALVLIMVGVIATAFYVEKIYRLLKKDGK